MASKTRRVESSKAELHEKVNVGSEKLNYEY